MNLSASWFSACEVGFSLDREIAQEAGLLSDSGARSPAEFQPVFSNAMLPSPVLLAQEAFAEAQPMTSDNLPASSSAVNQVLSGSEPPPFCMAQVTSTCNRGKQLMPLDITQVRRSTRANKFDGFKTSQPKDIRVAKSKVKPRVVPSASVSSANPPDDDRVSNMMKDTPIPILQHMGGTCGVPAQDLSPQKLLASSQEDDLTE